MAKCTVVTSEGKSWGQEPCPGITWQQEGVAELAQDCPGGDAKEVSTSQPPQETFPSQGKSFNNCAAELGVGAQPGDILASFPSCSLLLRDPSCDLWDSQELRGQGWSPELLQVPHIPHPWQIPGASPHPSALIKQHQGAPRSVSAEPIPLYCSGGIHSINIKQSRRLFPLRALSPVYKLILFSQYFHCCLFQSCQMNALPHAGQFALLPVIKT